MLTLLLLNSYSISFASFRKKVFSLFVRNKFFSVVLPPFSLFELRLMRQNAIFFLSLHFSLEPQRPRLNGVHIIFSDFIRHRPYINFLCFVRKSFSIALERQRHFPTTKSIYFVRAFVGIFFFSSSVLLAGCCRSMSCVCSKQRSH